MKIAIARRFESISRSLPRAVARRLRHAVPQYQMRTRGLRHPELEYQQALALVKPMFPTAQPAERDAMAFYLVAVSGIAELDSSVHNVATKLDSLSEMSEMQSLRLQMAMDRMAKFMSTLSNMVKKTSDTASAITQNLK